ncbi:MAG: hypothetical protein L0Z50_25390, partial [Verrucomicrobiales bacterium]|nr:hypothetical protein [Verrucomicrobiales bacterium]
SSRLVLTSTAATLAGTLRVELADGYSPAMGERFDAVTFSARSGEFEKIELPNLGAGKKLIVTYGNSAVTLEVVAP